MWKCAFNPNRHFDGQTSRMLYLFLEISKTDFHHKVTRKTISNIEPFSFSLTFLSESQSPVWIQGRLAVPKVIRHSYRHSFSRYICARKVLTTHSSYLIAFQEHFQLSFPTKFSIEQLGYSKDLFIFLCKPTRCQMLRLVSRHIEDFNSTVCTRLTLFTCLTSPK